MAHRNEKKMVRIEKPLEVQIYVCDSCGTELATSRDVYFGDERLVIEGEDKPWFVVGERRSERDYPSDLRLDFCSRECVGAWSRATDPVTTPQ